MDEELEGLHEAIEIELMEARLYPQRLMQLHAEYRRNALQHPSQREFWLSACRLANERLAKCESCRKIGVAFADQELPLRRE